MRLALGASRLQLMRQLMMESLLLSTISGLVGILLSVWTVRGLLRFLPADGMALIVRADPDPRILGFTLALALITGTVFGFAPALQSTRVDLWDTLKNASGAVTGTSGSVLVRKALVTAQVALSFLLLAGAGLFVKSLSNLKNTNTGFLNIDT